MDKKNLVYP